MLENSANVELATIDEIDVLEATAEVGLDIMEELNRLDSICVMVDDIEDLTCCVAVVVRNAPDRVGRVNP